MNCIWNLVVIVSFSFADVTLSIGIMKILIQIVLGCQHSSCRFLVTITNATFLYLFLLALLIRLLLQFCCSYYHASYSSAITSTITLLFLLLSLFLLQLQASCEHCVANGICRP